MARYRKKPVVIDAVKWDGTNLLEVGEFCPDVLREKIVDGKIVIPTNEGKMIAEIGDYIIKEPFPIGDRQFYPCKPEIFEQTYEPVEE